MDNEFPMSKADFFAENEALRTEISRLKFEIKDLSKKNREITQDILEQMYSEMMGALNKAIARIKVSCATLEPKSDYFKGYGNYQ